jgi:predicted nucleotidyltransferase/DNA-binding XRE family transcriptional regulator
MEVSVLIREARERAHLTQAELAARAGTSQPAISRYEAATASPSVQTLDRLLASMGARLELSVTPAPRALDVRTPRLAKIRANRDLIRKAARRHHATNLHVFGSVARGDDGPDSDIDFLVDLDVHTHGLIPVMELNDELARLLGEKVDVAPRSALAPHVAKQALAEAVPL